MFISVSCRFKFKNKKVCIGCFYVKKKTKKTQHLSSNTKIHFHVHAFFKSPAVPAI